MTSSKNIFKHRFTDVETKKIPSLFSLCRNAVLEGNLSELGYSSPKARKTGTTIAGIVFKDGVILAADTRATDDMVVADKNCMKIHYIAPNIYCCGAGVAADAEVTTQMMSSNVELHSAQDVLPFSLHLNCGFCNASIPGTRDILAAISIFEDRYRPNLELEEAKKLVRDAIAAGIFCDLGSGSNVDLCVITQAGVQYLRGYDQPYKYKPGTTAVLTKTVTPLPLDIVDESIQLMDTQ
uniref:Proteasome subunit beta n=1 Tax=Oncorhynchus kisutch TaxID=8019 RepID=A0A8C7KPR9_ONCKI